MHACQHIADSTQRPIRRDTALRWPNTRLRSRGRGRSPHTGRTGGPGTVIAMDMTGPGDAQRRTWVQETLPKAGVSRTVPSRHISLGAVRDFPLVAREADPQEHVDRT